MSRLILPCATQYSTSAFARGQAEGAGQRLDRAAVRAFLHHDQPFALRAVVRAFLAEAAVQPEGQPARVAVEVQARAARPGAAPRRVTVQPVQHGLGRDGASVPQWRLAARAPAGSATSGGRRARAP